MSGCRCPADVERGWMQRLNRGIFKNIVIVHKLMKKGTGL